MIECLSLTQRTNDSFLTRVENTSLSRGGKRFFSLCRILFVAEHDFCILFGIFQVVLLAENRT